MLNIPLDIKTARLPRDSQLESIAGVSKVKGMRTKDEQFSRRD